MEGMNKFKSLITMLNGGAQKGNREVHKLLINIVTLTIIGREECHQLHHGLLLFPGSYCTRQLKYDALNRVCTLGARSGAVVRALASHQCGPCSNPSVVAICGMSLLVVLSFAPRGFSPVTPLFPRLFNNQHFQTPIRNRTHGHVSLVLRLVGKQIIKKIYNFHDS